MYHLLPAAVLLLALGGCAPPAPSVPQALAAAAPETFYVQTDGGNRTLYFRTVLENRTDTTLTVYLFAYAADNVAQPPLRSVYPPAALRAMPADRRFSVSRPALGLQRTLAPRDTASFTGALPLPTEWANGAPIESERFRDLTVYAYSAEGRRLMVDSWTIYRPRGE